MIKVKVAKKSNPIPLGEVKAGGVFRFEENPENCKHFISLGIDVYATKTVDRVDYIGWVNTTNGYLGQNAPTTLVWLAKSAKLIIEP